MDHNNSSKIDKTVGKVVNELCAPNSYEAVFHYSRHDSPMPSVETLRGIVENLRAVIFPGYFGRSELKPETMKYHVGAIIDDTAVELTEQVKRGFCFECDEAQHIKCDVCSEKAHDVTIEFISALPEIRRLLASDAAAAFEGDPAARSIGETIFSYPSIFAMSNFRIANALFKLDVPIIPRIITELAHSETGIDIHPGAQIGERFFMDHGTGIVIGETSVIGRNVRIYQGVTLGAKSFPLDENGRPIKGIPRHPIVEDDVIIYSGATILGRVTIGKGAVVGGNVWLMIDVPAGARIVQGKLEEPVFESGSGI